MTEDLPITLDQAQVSRIRAELNDSLNVQQWQRRNNVLLAIAGPLVLFGSITVAAWLLSGRIRTNVGGVIVFGAFVLLVSLTMVLLVLRNADDECAKAAFKLQALDAEAAQTARALELAQSGSPFALFLRSFGAELTGLSYSSKESINFSLGMERISAARTGELFVLNVQDLDHLVAYRKWSAQLEVLRSIQQRYPTVLLGNTALDSDMRAELTRTGVIELTIQAQEWWPIFLALSRHAYLIILYIETASPMLLREMQHIGSHGLRYVIFADDAELRRLAEEPGLGEYFLCSAVARLKPGNVADLCGLLTSQTATQSAAHLRAPRPS